MVGLGELGRRRVEDVEEFLARLERVQHLLARQILARLVRVEGERHHRVVADDRLRVGVCVEHLLVVDEPVLHLALGRILVGNLEAAGGIETLDGFLAQRRDLHHVGGSGAEEGDVPAELPGFGHRPDGLAKHGAEHDEVAAIGLHLGDLRAEIRGAALVARDRRRLRLHGGELLIEAVEHVLPVLVVLMHDAGLLEALPLHHVFQRGPCALDVRQQIVELQSLLRLGRIELEGELGRRQREELQDAGVEEDILRGEHCRRSHRSHHREDLVALDQFLRSQHGLFRIIAAVLDDQSNLAAVDPAGCIDLLGGHLHAICDRDAPALDRTRQVLVSADDDLGCRDALVGDLGLRCGRQTGEHHGAHSKAECAERFRH